ncbi:MAG: hypothetical protein WCT04_07705 [Planctomycetota bacterium]
MTNLPPRKRFQFHLSTAIVMMFVTGGIIWANVSCTDHFVTVIFEDGHGPREYVLSEREMRHATFKEGLRHENYRNKFLGWPFVVYLSHEIESVVNEKVVPSGIAREEYWMNESLVGDCLAAAIILFAVWFICEWLIRRRAAQKKN